MLSNREEEPSVAVLSIANLSKSYQSYGRPSDRLRELVFPTRKRSQSIEVLHDISFELGKGQILGVIGPNGAGKSTLLQIIAGTLKPTEGAVTVNGRVTALLELGAGVDPEMTGLENIRLMGSTYGIPEKVIAESQEAIIEFSGLGDFIHQPVKTYSSGMFVRLAFSISTALEPDVLIVDEALSVGDVGFQAKCLDRLDQLIKNGTSILLASHDLQLIKNYCHSAICIQQGSIVEQGSPEIVTEKYLQIMRGDKQVGESTLGWNADEQSVGFGSGKAKIVACEIVKDRQSSSVLSGEQVTVVVKASTNEPVLSPVLSVMLRDARGYNLYGLQAFGANNEIEVIDGVLTARFQMPISLAAGYYSFTVRLEDMPTKQMAELLDKRVGICSFSVEDKGIDFLGSVNLGGKVMTQQTETEIEHAS